MTKERTASRPCREAGFTLAEMIVALAVTSLLLLAVLATFDLNSRVARVQTNVADMQQSLRVAQDQLVRTVRMAGRGSLPLVDADPLPQGVAIAVRNNVADNQFVVASDAATRILPGTDVLTVRGVFGTLYQINSAAAVTYDNPADPTTGRLTVLNTTPSGATQDLEPLKAAITNRLPEALLLAGAADDGVHALVELVPGASVIETDKVVLSFKIKGGTRADAYGRLSTGGAFPGTSLQNISFTGIVEEYRYYVREEHAIAADRNSELTPKLALARFYPGMDEPYKGEAANARLDLADNILDLQVAFGFDSTIGGRRADDIDHVGPDDQILETADGTNDDWLFNGTADKPEDAAWQTPPRPGLQYVRVTTVARTDRRDPQYQAPLLTRSEDHAYTTTDPATNTDNARMYRRRSLRTVIDVRNL